MPSFAYIPKLGNIPAAVAVVNADTYAFAGPDIELGVNSVNALIVCVDSVTNTQKVYVANQDLILGNQISIINSLTNTVVDNIITGIGQINGMVVTPDRTRIYATANNIDIGNNYTSVYDTTSPYSRIATIHNSGGNPRGIAITPDGLKTYVYCYSTGGVDVIDTDPSSGTYNTILTTVVVGGGGYGIAITPDGLFAYVTVTGAVKIIDTTTDTIVSPTITVGTTPEGIAITPDGLLAFVTNSADGTVSIIDTVSKTVVGTTSIGLQPIGVAITPDGLRAFALDGGDDGIYVVSTTNPYPILTNFSDGGTGGHFGIGMFIGTIPDLTIEIIQGTITTLTTPTSGTITDVNGNVFPFDDSTLTDRSISLSIGSIIIGAYSGAYDITTNIVPIQSIYDTVNLTLTANTFTAANVKCALQVAQCCAVGKINKYITNQDDGKRCEKDFDDAELMFNMIDSLRGFIPEGDLVSGHQATYEIVVTSSFGAKVVTLSIGDANYSFTSFTGNSIDFATDIAFNINALYPQSYSYYAVSSGINVVVSGIAFDEDNSTAVTGSTTNGTLTLSPPGYLFGGTTPVYQGTNCLTNQEAQIILGKLKSLCGC